MVNPTEVAKFESAVEDAINLYHKWRNCSEKDRMVTMEIERVHVTLNSSRILEEAQSRL